MTRDEFKEFYAKGSGIDISQLEKFGLIALPCDCGDESCKGWQMQHLPLIDSSQHSEYREEIERITNLQRANNELTANS